MSKPTIHGRPLEPHTILAIGQASDGLTNVTVEFKGKGHGLPVTVTINGQSAMLPCELLKRVANIFEL